MLDPEEIKKLSYLKAVKLEDLIDAVEERISKASNSLHKTILEEFLKKLNTESGKVVAQFNKETLSLFNKAFKIYQEETKEQLVKSIVGDIGSILDMNDDFYKKSAPSFDIKKENIKKILNRRLGINEDGTLIRQGYMNGLLDDGGIRSEIQKFVFKEIFKSSGLKAFEKSLKEFIVGDEGKFGTFQRYYRGFSYDAYAQLNAFTGNKYAEELGMNYFIYNGGLIKTSRSFCKERNGEVFSREEAERWKYADNLKAIDSRETYNWLIDRGGYNCRHAIDFIAPEIAYALRPDLKKK